MSAPQIVTPDMLPRLTQLTVQLGPWAMPIVEALQAGMITVAVPHRTAPPPLGDMRRSVLPMLCWVGDDDDLSTGPDGWSCAHTLARWSRASIVHGSGGERAHYLQAVLGTIATGRMLLVETASRHIEAWRRLLIGKPGLIIVPRSGPHPLATDQVRH